MITVSGLAKNFAHKTLFEGVDLLLLGGTRYGLVGANGSGKSTFLKILDGSEEASAGSVNIHKGIRLGVLKQDRFLNDDDSILDVAMAGDREALAALTELDAAYASEDALRIVSAEDAALRTDARTLKSRAGTILEGLGIRTHQHNDPLRTLSGGYKLRVLLAQVLVARPDALMLDEPTNHLDILSIRWLEKFLMGFAGCAVIISHDARFLQNVTNAILDVDYGTVTAYPHGFTKFLADKAQRRAQREAEQQGIADEIARKREFVERFGAKATKAAQAQSRVKQIERLEEELSDLPDSSRRAPTFRFEVARESGKEVLVVENVSKAFDDVHFGKKQVLNQVSLTVRQKERVAIIGENGVGKSTLLKIACGHLRPDAGATKWGIEVRPGYFAQDHKDLVRESDTPESFLSRKSGDQGRAFVRGMLGRVLLSGDDALKPCGALSGGESARLVFAALMVEKPNVLVLDEPTNHLDLESIDALMASLQAYAGTLIFVSHDRGFVQALATRIIEITRTGVRDFLGTYDEYLAACGDDHLDADGVLQHRRKQRAADGEAAPAPTGQLSWEEQKKRKNQRVQNTKRRDEVVALLEAGEQRRQAITEQFCAPGFFEKTPAQQLQRLQEEEASLATRIEALMAEWEALEAKLAEVDGT